MFTNQNKKNNHNFFMNLALKQAKIHLGNTSDNPSVGCAIVKDNILLSLGNTGLKGRPHAEIRTLKSSKKNLEGSTMYVTLEPCSHYGKTPPCVYLIVKKKIKNVFYSINDPDVRSFMKSKKILSKKSISVKSGILSKEIKSFYKSYTQYKLKDFPFVTGKLAISKDFFTVSKKNKWITNIFSRGRVHLLRSQYDCIITSSETVKRDNPYLDCRILGLNNYSPVKIILDNKLKTTIKSNVDKKTKKSKTIVFYNLENKRKIKSLKKLRIKTIWSPLDNNKNLDLKFVLLKVKKLGFSRVFLESGIKLISAFLKGNFLNDFMIFKSNKMLINIGNKNFRTVFNTYLKQKTNHIEKINLFGESLTSYYIK